MSTLVCPACGFENGAGSQFCTHCGSPMAQDPSSHLRPGSRIREYEIVRFIAAGGMGEVYEARHTLTGDRLALKRILPEYSENPSLRSRFIEEARVMTLLEHRNIVRSRDPFLEDGRLYLVMQYIEGHSLEQLVDSLQEQGRCMEWKAAVSICCQILDALEYMHQLRVTQSTLDQSGNPVERPVNGVLHRDIKPSNIMVDGAKRAYLMDFGISKAEGRDKLTKTGGIVGTYEYMSPEQIQGRKVGPASDQYSLATTLYNALAGSPPFPQETTGGFNVMEGHIRRSPPELAGRRSDIPPHISGAIMKALGKTPEDRFESCGQFREVLLGKKAAPAAPQSRPATFPGEVGPDDGSSAGDPETEFTVEPTAWKSNTRWWVVGIIGVLVVFGVAFAYMSSPDKASQEQHKDKRKTEKTEKKKELPKSSSKTEERTALKVVRKSEKKEDLEAEQERKDDEARRKETEKQRQLEAEALARAEEERKEAELKALNHAEDCKHMECGKDRYGTSCGSCKSSETCRQGQCRVDVPAGMVFVEAGCFTMGGCARSNCPKKRVCLSPFAIDGTTQTGAGNPTWFKAQRYCERRGLKLATEAQWEYAAVQGKFHRQYGVPAEWVRDWYASDAYDRWTTGSYDPGVFNRSSADKQPGSWGKRVREGSTRYEQCKVFRSWTYSKCRDWKRCRGFWGPDANRKYGWRCVKEL